MQFNTCIFEPFFLGQVTLTIQSSINSVYIHFTFRGETRSDSVQAVLITELYSCHVPHLVWLWSQPALSVLLMFYYTDSLSTFLPLSLCHLAALRWTLPVTTVLQIAELWFLHMQIMQCFHNNIDRAKLVDSQSVFVFSLGGLDTTQYRLM